MTAAIFASAKAARGNLHWQVLKRTFAAQTNAEKEGIVYNACIRPRKASNCTEVGTLTRRDTVFKTVL